MIDARNNGIPLIEHAPKASITHSIIDLADAIAGVQKSGPGDQAGRKSGLTRLLPFMSGRGK
ncbi:MAG: pilus assembly protein CpaE, partial [Thermoguttaceae bacterium]|nr:pilus assembly protein CpaE [Thermoguttaceae bacterium]